MDLKIKSGCFLSAGLSRLPHTDRKIALGKENSSFSHFDLVQKDSHKSCFKLFSQFRPSLIINFGMFDQGKSSMHMRLKSAVSYFYINHMANSPSLDQLAMRFGALVVTRRSVTDVVSVTVC